MEAENINTNVMASHKTISSKAPKRLVPKLRFANFEGCWRSWSIQDLVKYKVLDKPMDGNHGNIHPISSDFVEEGIPFIMANNLNNGKINLQNVKCITKDQADNLQKGFSVTGDVLLTHKGSIGETAIVPEIETDYLMLTPQVTYYRVIDHKKLNNLFLKSTFETQSFQKRLKILADGGTRPYVGITQQRQLEISIPSLPEQQKIAQFLTAVDSKLQQLNQKKELLVQYKKGVMQQLFSQQLRFKKDDGSDYPDWEEKRLGEIADRISTKNTSNEVNFVLTNSATQGVVSQQEYFDKEIANQNNLEGYYIVSKDDFVYNPRISASAPVGPIKRNKLQKGVMSPLYSIFRFKESLLEYFEHYFETTNWHKYLHSVANFGARHDRMNITNSDFFKMPIPMPTYDERKKIANYLSAIDSKIETVTQQIEATQQFKKGLLQRMFV